MSSSLADYVNASIPTVSVSNLEDFFSNFEEISTSPIDFFIKDRKEILSLGDSALLDKSDVLGSYLVVGLVSSTEYYVRSLLARLVELCPCARSVCAKKTINLGGLLWHGKEQFSKSVFDNMSFADPEELKRAAREFVGYELKDVDFRDILKEYSKICQIRHGIVHSSSVLPGKNAVQLDLTRSPPVRRTVVRYRELQNVAEVLSVLVSMLNRALFEEFCKRWAIDWRRRADWDVSQERARFSQMWEVFVCEAENSRLPKSKRPTRYRCMEAVKKHYGIS